MFHWHKTPQPELTSLDNYGGTILPVIGNTLIQVRRGEFHCKLDSKLHGGVCLHWHENMTHSDNDEITPPVQPQGKKLSIH